MRAPPSSFAAKAGLLLASMALAALLLETALRVLAIDVASYHSIAGFAVYDPVLGWKLAPARDAVFRGAHFAVRVRQNAEGFRDRHYDYARTPGRRRVLVLGDSVVWCWGVEQDECFTERIERTLADTDVINTGVPGYSTAQELLFYEREGRRYAPDVVVLVVAPNDVSDNLDHRGPRFQLAGGELRYEPARPPRRKSIATEWLQAHSRVFAFAAYATAVVGRTIRHPSDENPSAAPPPDDDRPAPVAAPSPGATPPSWALAEALFDRLLHAVRADGARLVVVLEETPAAQRAWLASFWSARRVPVLDLAPLLAAATRRGERVRLEGDPHLASAGQAVVAAELARVVGAELAALDSSPGP